MNKITDIIFKESLSLKYDLEKYELIEHTDQIRISYHISMIDMQNSILDTVANNDFDLVTYAYNMNFIDSSKHTKDDVILELKIYLWSYLFPENELNTKEKLYVLDILKALLTHNYANNRWLLLSDLYIITSKLTGKDYFDSDNLLQELFLSGKVEFKDNDGIDVNGFMKYNSSVRWKSIIDGTPAS